MRKPLLFLISLLFAVSSAPAFAQDADLDEGMSDAPAAQEPKRAVRAERRAKMKAHRQARRDQRKMRLAQKSKRLKARANRMDKRVNRMNQDGPNGAPEAGQE